MSLTALRMARTFLLGYPGVRAIREFLVTFVGPGQVWVLTGIDIDNKLSSRDVTDLVRGIELGLRRLIDLPPVSRTRG